MRLGVSTASLYPLETEKALLEVARSGCECTEIFFNATCEMKQEFVDLLDSIRCEYGIYITSVHPTMSMAESYMFFSDYTRRYEEGIEQYKRYAEIAAQLGAKYIIMHGGKPNHVMDGYGYCERFLQVSEAVKESGATLLHENVVHHRAGDIEFLRFMAEQLGDRVGFCLDVKQSIRAGYSPFDALRAVSANIKHIHLSDNQPENDCMLPCKGDFDFSAFLSLAKELGYKGDAVVEVYRNAYGHYEELFESLNVLKKVIL